MRLLLRLGACWHSLLYRGSVRQPNPPGNQRQGGEEAHLYTWNIFVIWGSYSSVILKQFKCLMGNAVYSWILVMRQILRRVFVFHGALARQ